MPHSGSNPTFLMQGFIKSRCLIDDSESNENFLLLPQPHINIFSDSSENPPSKYWAPQRFCILYVVLQDNSICRHIVENSKSSSLKTKEVDFNCFPQEVINMKPSVCDTALAPLFNPGAKLYSLLANVRCKTSEAGSYQKLTLKTSTTREFWPGKFLGRMLKGTDGCFWLPLVKYKIKINDGRNCLVLQHSLKKC